MKDYATLVAIMSSVSSERQPATAVLVVGCGAIALFLAARILRSEADFDAARPSSGGWLESHGRIALGWLLEPLVILLVRLRISPNIVTMASLAPALASGWLAAQGRFAAAGIMYLLAGGCDFLDGRIARRLGSVTRGGALLDSVIDRYGECAFLTGLAWYYRNDWVFAAVTLSISGSLLVPYVRARAEGLGLNVTTGWLQRPERVVLLGLAAILTPVLTPASGPQDGTVMVWTVTALAVFTHLTVAHRLWHGVRMLNRSTSEAGRDKSSEQSTSFLDMRSSN
jgi:phosphatidylglycerophosphate synthase